MEDAISQLQDLGVTRGQAKKALARYNNDVARAADFIFSGAFLSDEEEDEANIETDEQLAIRLSREEEENQQLRNNFNDNNIFKENIITPPSPVATVENEPVQLDKSANHSAYDSNKWSVVPFKESDKTATTAITTATNAYTTTTTASSAQLMNESALTWWKDPEDPSERMAMDDLPIGLRPPSYNFAYSPILVQALFHVTAFREAVLSFRPTPYSWGAPKNYWKGFGEPVPRYIMREVVTKKQVTKPNTITSTEWPLSSMPWSEPSLSSHLPPHSQSHDEDLISLGTPSPSPPLQDKMDALTLDDGDRLAINSANSFENNINEEAAERDLPLSIVESTPIEEETVEFVDHVENELELMPKCLEALAEIQKLFAFLSSTSRLYGNVSHYVRALSTKLTSNGWEFSDQTFEAFLDMMIHGLVDADERSNKALDVSFVPLFRSLFLLKAKIEYGDDYDNEEVYYLTLNLDKTMNSFHGCLDPLVYESYEADDAFDGNADPTTLDQDDNSDSDSNEGSYKFTTFKQIPPILMVVLENRTAPKKSHFDYRVDKTIYMDRYMLEKKDSSLAGFKEMEACRKEIAKSRLEMEKLKGGGNSPMATDKRDLLLQTLSYFENKEQDQEELAAPSEMNTLKFVLNSVKDTIESRLQKLQELITQQKEKIDNVFNAPNMKENAYELRATFHHDGMSGTGHYWAYIWVEPSEESLLEDIPSEGGWFRFCDAIVTPATEQDIINDPIQPFSLMYVSASLPKFSKEQLYACIPEELKDFVNKDNELLAQEIHDYDHPIADGNASLISTSEDDVVFTEKASSVQLDHHYADLDSSVTYDDNTSVGTAVNGGQPTNTTEYNLNNNNNELLNYSFSGQGVSRFKEQVVAKIYKVSSYPSDDYRFIKSFETFLARSQNQLILEHLYMLYSSEQAAENDTDLMIDETKARKDADLRTIWQEYDNYVSIAETITVALGYFIKKDFANALQHLIDSKRVEALWKTQMMLDTDISTAYSGLETLSFYSIIEKYGKECLKILNNAAYAKASNPSYRTRGLEDALRIAHQAQNIIGPDNITEDTVYQSLGSVWLSFTDHASAETPLTDRQVELLNHLILAYLEGQVAGSSVAQSRSQSPIYDSDDNSFDQDNSSGNINQLPWQRYKQVCSESEQMLSTLEK